MASDGGEKAFDPVLFDVTRIPCDEIANQITLDDFAVFQSIRPEELTSVAWQGRNKMTLCPNVVEITQRFNRTSFWAISVILQAQTLKNRTEVLVQFIRIAKRLHEYSNYHGMLALVSALRHVSIARLTDTWARVSRRDKQNFESLVKFVPEDEGHQRLRETFEKIQLPCIPHLGIFLKELIYIDVAHPDNGGLESEGRMLKMNNILRLISEFQQSDYTHLPHHPYIQSYLKSFDYINELQRFLEDDNYKQSYEVQPKISESSSSKKFGTMDDLGPKTITARFSRGHRRTVSLGRSPRRDPISISLLDDQPLSPANGTQSPSVNSLPGHYMPTNGISSFRHPLNPAHRTMKPGGSLGSNGSSDMSMRSDGLSVPDEIPPESIIHEGCLLRKKNAKRGQKMALKYWKRYWIVLTQASGNGYQDNVLLLYETKSPFPFTRTVDRANYQKESAKQMILSHFIFSEECPNPDEFSLTHESSGECYRFKSSGPVAASMWKQMIAEAKKAKVHDLIELNVDAAGPNNTLR